MVFPPGYKTADLAYIYKFKTFRYTILNSVSLLLIENSSTETILIDINVQLPRVINVH